MRSSRRTSPSTGGRISAPDTRTAAQASVSSGTGKRASAWPFVLGVFAASRVLFLLVGALAVFLLPGAEPAGDPLNPPGFLSYWANWDGGWYSLIGTEGYGVRDPESTAFFPLYPLLVGLGSAVVGGPAVWGVLISLVCAVFAMYFLYSIAGKLFDARAARYSVLALAFFPTAFFLNSVYTEAPFLALSTGCIWAATVRRDFLLAGILGALAASTRNVGVVLVVPLFLEWWGCRREAGLRGLAGTSLVPVGLLAYVGFLWARFGDPLVFARQQGEYWGRTLTDPSVTAARAWETASEGTRYVTDPVGLFAGASVSPSFDFSNLLNVFFLAFLLVVIGVGVAVLPPGLSFYTAIITLLPVLTPAPSFPLMSMPRFALGAFPVFLVLGVLLARAGRGAVFWIVPSATLGAFLTALFVTWRWVA